MIEANRLVHILMVEEDAESMKEVKAHLEEDLGYAVTMSAKMDLAERLACERYHLILVDLMIKPFSKDDQGEQVENLHFEGINWRNWARILTAF